MQARKGAFSCVCCLGSSRALSPAFEVFDPLPLESTRCKTRQAEQGTVGWGSSGEQLAKKSSR